MVTGEAGMYMQVQFIASLPGVGKTRNEMKRNKTEAVPTIIASSQRASDRGSTSSYISYPELIYILQYC